MVDPGTFRASLDALDDRHSYSFFASNWTHAAATTATHSTRPS